MFISVQRIGFKLREKLKYILKKIIKKFKVFHYLFIIKYYISKILNHESGDLLLHIMVIDVTSHFLR